MKNCLIFLLVIPFFIVCCNPGDDIDVYDTEFYLTGELDGEAIDYRITSDDIDFSHRLGTMSVGGGDCANDYIGILELDRFGLFKIEIGFIHFYHGPCDGKEQFDLFDEVFEPGLYPFNESTFGVPGMEKSVSITIHDSGIDFYDSEQADNTNSYFEIISSADASDNFYSRRVIEGKMDCVLKHTATGSIVEFKDAEFKIVVALPK